MSRYDIFQREQGKLSSRLYNTGLVLQNKETESMESVLQLVLETMRFFSTYLLKEDEIILLPLADLEPAVPDIIKREQQKLIALAAHITNDIQGVSANGYQTEIDKVSSFFMQFTIICLQWMAKKEALLNPVLWRYFSDEHLKCMHQELAYRTSPKKVNELQLA